VSGYFSSFTRALETHTKRHADPFWVAVRTFITP
jgi:hypothetical protein